MGKASNDGESLWVFGYGSLMWNPGFPFVEDLYGRIYGYHRCLCVLSTTYRGTPKTPGLVLGLDRGGSTMGRAFHVAPEKVNDTMAYLEDREQITQVYCPHFTNVHLSDGRKVRAYTFISRHDHRQYAGHLGLEETATLVAAGCGERGRSLDYVANTVRHLDGLGITNTNLHKVLEMAKKL